VPTLADHILFLPRLMRDHWAEKAGRYPYGTETPPRYLSQSGIALACGANGSLPYVMFGIEGRPELVDWSTYRPCEQGAIAWLRIEDLPEFNRRILPRIERPFVLVTGESDYSVPTDFAAAADHLVSSGKLRRWFSTNYDGSSHDGLIAGMPLGLNYARKTDVHFYGRYGGMGITPVYMRPPRAQEAAWDAAVRGAPPLAARRPTAIADFHLNAAARGTRFGESRVDIYRSLEGNVHVEWLHRRTSLTRLLQIYSQHAFVISPHGRGLDCYRTWEAMFAGCIPIVKRSPLDALYRDLPVAIVEDWREINAASIARWLDRFGPAFDRAETARTLSAAHWIARLKEA
jgi:hypothetical protein